jgi:hypothetical protein
MVRPSLITEIDFAISRFESWRPSQPKGSLPGDFGYSRKCRHFRRLTARSPVSDEEFGRNRAESLESRGVSPLAGFSISEICVRGCPETGCVSAETGSNPQEIRWRLGDSTSGPLSQGDEPAEDSMCFSATRSPTASQQRGSQRWPQPDHAGQCDSHPRLKTQWLEETWRSGEDEPTLN